MIKRCLKESERAFSIPRGIWIGTRLIRERRKEIGIDEGERGIWDESKREAKSKMSRRVRVKEKDDVVVVWKEASPGAGTCSKGY